MNVLTSNQQFQKVINLINNKQIDILLLNEINFKWINNLKPVLHKFKHKLEFPRSDNFGIGLYSNIPNIKSNLEFIDNFEIPVIKSEFSINNEHFSLLYLHLLPPGNFENFKFRNKQLDKISEYSKSLNKNKIIAGDFNLTSYSYFYKQFIKNSNLTDSRKGFGIQHSWPVGAPFFYTTLDHFFLSKNLKTVNRNTEDEIGSDHFPVYIEITY